MSPGKLSLNKVPSQNQNESYVSEMSKNEHNQESRPQSVSPEGYSNNCTQDEPATYLQPSNIIDDYGFLPAQYFSPAKKTNEHSKRYSSDSNLMNCRSFLDNSKYSLKYDQPVNDERPLNELHYASTSCLSTEKKNSSLSSEECSFEFSRTRSGSFRNRRKFSSLTNIDIKPTANDDKRKRTTKNNLGISKKFGSASEIFQKIFTKKTERTKSKWTVHEPKLNEKTMSFNSNVKLQQWNLTERSTEQHVLEGCRRQTCPPYMSPIRATLSQPVLVGKRNDSGTSFNSLQTKHKDSNTSVGKHNTSSPSLGQQANVQKCYVSGSNLDLFNPVLTCKQNYSNTSLNCLRPAFASEHTHSDPSLNSVKPAFASKRTHSGSSLNSFKGLKCNKSGTSLDSFHSAKSNLTRQTSSSSSMKWNTPEEDKHSLSSTSLCLTDDQSYTIEGLKMCCLLLPSPKRKKLHLLLKLMAKMVNNKQLNLSKQMSTKSLVLQTFWRCILSCEVEVGLDEILAIKVVTYMMEHYDQIMAVSEELKSDVQERMLYLRRSQVKYNETEDVENIPVTFCQQISTDEYREQKLSYSENAISMLLEDIINSKTMAVKDKRKKLKKFKQEYPDIYAKRLPTTSHEAELFPQKPKIKQPMLNMKRSLTKLKSLR
ncbi:uncharacterized protein [Antedon mediterranea]|uniref:uncharacterized protein isoform X1 n=1 Tax=Antedon mediterranea TaxID=105859 RepID=UPI003AF41886